MKREYSKEQREALNKIREHTEFLRKEQLYLEQLMSRALSLKYAVRTKKEELWDTKERISKVKKEIRQMEKSIRKTRAHYKLTLFDIAKNETSK